MKKYSPVKLRRCAPAGDFAIARNKGRIKKVGKAGCTGEGKRVEKLRGRPAGRESGDPTESSTQKHARAHREEERGVSYTLFSAGNKSAGGECVSRDPPSPGDVVFMRRHGLVRDILVPTPCTFLRSLISCDPFAQPHPRVARLHPTH